MKCCALLSKPIVIQRVILASHPLVRPPFISLLYRKLYLPKPRKPRAKADQNRLLRGRVVEKGIMRCQNWLVDYQKQFPVCHNETIKEQLLWEEHINRYFCHGPLWTGRQESNIISEFYSLPISFFWKQFLWFAGKIFDGLTVLSVIP